MDGNTAESLDYINILDLPAEVILKIFSYVNIRMLFKNVILTCKYFRKILAAPGLWETLFALKFKEHSIVQDLPYINSLCDVCFTFEDVECYWKYRKQKNVVKLKTKKLVGHYAAVDAVHVVKQANLCVSGSRDRTAILWNLSGFLDCDDESEVAPLEILLGHEGWIWSIDSDRNKENLVITCSWDKNMKIWDLANNGELVNTLTYHPSAILDLRCHDNVYTTGCYDKYVRTYDPRSNEIVLQSAHHRKPVLCIQVTDNYILSGSEDQTVGVFDIRAGKLRTTLRVDSPILCMNLGFEQGFNYLRIGGKNGSLYLYDITGDKFSLLNLNQLWSKYKVTSLCNYQGALVACSQRGAVRMLTPDRSVTLLEKFDKHTGDVAAAHARKGILVTGSSDNSLYAWTFNE